MLNFKQKKKVFTGIVFTLPYFVVSIQQQTILRETKKTLFKIIIKLQAKVFIVWVIIVL